jgi:hypothetical protein
MGNMFAQDLAGETSLPIEKTIAIHLQANHFPPVPLSWVTPCIEAIEACNDEDDHKKISLPEGVTYLGGDFAPAYKIVESYHLSPWIHYYGWDEEGEGEE